MTARMFLQFGVNEQLTMLQQWGTFLATVKDCRQSFTLFYLENFYVELITCYDYKNNSRVNAFTDVNRLERYLIKIDISEVLSTI